MIANPATIASVTDSPGADAQHPWPGLSPYTEELQGLFHGRSSEADELFRRVRRKVLTILFGLSGLGKTSLLQAGLYPKLRREGMVPVSLRLDYAAEAPDPAGQIKAAIESGLAAADLKKATVPTREETLWEYFHRADLTLEGHDGKPVSLVLIFDQFEELFTIGQTGAERRARAALFVEELASLVENRAPAALEQRLEQNADEIEKLVFDRQDYHVLLCLREDFLAQLEGLHDRLPSLTGNRMRLTRMNGSQALEAVEDPAAGLVARDVARQIVHFVAGSRPKESDNGDGRTAPENLAELEIEPSLLSLVCRELNNRRLQLGLPQISADLLAGSSERILQDFYERCLADQPLAVRKFVEDDLLTDSGFRENLALERARKILVQGGAAPGAIDELVKRRLLHLQERLHTQRVELTHDVLTKVIQKSRDARHLREHAWAVRKKRLFKWGVPAGFLVILGLLGLDFWTRAKLNDALQLEQTAMQTEKEAKLDLEKAKLALEKANREEKEAKKQLAKASYIHSLNLAELTWQRGEVVRPRKLLDDSPEEFRHWEWKHFLLLTRPELFSLEGHFAKVGQVDFSSDGRRLVSASADKTVKVWDLFGNTQPLHLQHEGAVRQVVITPDGRFVSVTDEGTVQKWDAQGKKTGLPFQVAGATEVAFSPDCRYLATVAGDDNTVKIWDVNSGEEVDSFTHDEGINHLVFSPNGRLLASAGKKETVQVWDVKDRKLLGALHHTGGVNGVAFSHDGQRMASASDDKTVKVWAAGSGKELFSLRGHTDVVTQVVFSPDDKRLASASWDRTPTGETGTVKIWDVDSGRELLSLRGHTERITCLVFSPDGLRLSTASGETVKVWEVVTGAELFHLKGHTDKVNHLAFSPDGRRLASAGADAKVKVWTVTVHKEHLKLSGHTDSVSDLAFSHDGEWLASASKDKTVRVWESATGMDIVSFKDHKTTVLQVIFDPKERTRLASLSADGAVRVWETGKGNTLVGFEKVNQVAFHPEGNRLALACDDNTVKVWDIAKNQKLLELPGQAGRVHRVAYSADGKFLACAGEKGVQVWDANDGKMIRVLPGQLGKVQRILFSPDAQRLASIGEGQTVTLWNMRDGQPIILRGQGGRAHCVVFSPDGQSVASASDDKTVKVWNAENGQLLHILHGHSRPVTQVAFSPDPGGRRLASASEDKTVRIWDRAMGQELLTLQDPNITLGVYRILFSPDGQRLASAGNDKTVMVWESGFDLPTMAKRERNWQAAQGGTTAANGQSFAAEFHLTQLIQEKVEGRLGQALDPLKQADWHSRRGAVYAQQEKWVPALEDFAVAGKKDPNNFYYFYQEGMAHLGRSNLAGYQKLCAQVFQQFGEKTDADTADYLIWLATVDPKALGSKDFEKLVSMGEMAFKTKAENMNYLESLGSALYRVGDFSGARQRLEEAVGKSGTGGTIWMQIFLAMAHHQLQHPEEARRWLYKAAGQLAEKEQADWDGRVRHDRILAEAEGLLKFKVFLRRINDRLAAGDETDSFRKGSFRKIYKVPFAAGKNYQIEMLRNKDTILEPYLRLEDSAGKQMTLNDSAGKGYARIIYNCARADTYSVVATSYLAGTGRFTLTVQEKPLKKMAFKDGKARVDGKLEDSESYAIPLAEGKTYKFELTQDKASANLGPFLHLRDPTGQDVAIDNDNYTPSARITFACPQEGTYQILASGNPGRTGTFTLLIEEIAPILPAAIVLKGGKARVQGELTIQDLKDNRQLASFCKIYTVPLTAGKTYLMDMIRGQSNYKFNPFLRIEDSTGKPLGENDSFGYPIARMFFTCERTEIYRVVATSFVKQTGDYSLVIEERAALPDLKITFQDGKAQVDGALTSADLMDKTRPGSYCKIYTVQLAASKLYEMEMAGPKLEAFLRLEDAAGIPLVKENPKAGSLLYRNFREGTYRVIATTATPATGAFSLKIQEKELPELKLTLQNGKATLEDRFIGSEFKDSIQTASFCKTYGITLAAGKTYQIDMKKILGLDPYLRLEDDRGTPLANDDDSGGSLDARIIFSCVRTGRYRIIATTFNREEMGTYNLTVQER